MRGERRELRLAAKIDRKAGAEDEEVANERRLPFGKMEPDPTVMALRLRDAGSEADARIGMRHDAQHGLARRRRGEVAHIDEDAPARRIVEMREARLEAGKDDALRLVDLRDRGAADQDLDRPRPRLQRRRGIVEGGGAAAQHDDTLAGEAAEV